MDIIEAAKDWWDENKGVIGTAAFTVVICAMADRACRTESGRAALNGALVAGGTALAKGLSKKFEEVEIDDDKVVVSREEYELNKQELDLARRKEKLRKEEEALAKSASKSSASTSITDADAEEFVKRFKKEKRV